MSDLPRCGHRHQSALTNGVSVTLVCADCGARLIDESALPVTARPSVRALLKDIEKALHENARFGE